MPKQKVETGGLEIKRYRVSLFKTNQKLFYETLNKDKCNDHNDPNSAAATKFQSTIRSNELTHNKNVTWLDDVEEDLRTKEMQEDI